jgi:hypothetical protein
MVILAIASTSFEMMIAAKIPVWRRVASQYVVVNLLGSMALSYFLGVMFGAAGLIAMTAGLMSTFLSIPGYAFLNWCYDSPEAQAHGGNQIAYYSEKWQATKLRWGQTLRDLGEIIYKIIRIITFPIWFTRACIDKFNQIKTRSTRTAP